MELSILRRRGWTCWNSNPRRRVTGAVQREDEETEEKQDEQPENPENSEEEAPAEE